MAVFLVNTCKFSGCGLTFGNLSTLIQHIEETHLDTDPEVLEQQETDQPASVALSYVFRVFTDGATKEKRHRLSSLSPVSSLRSTTPTGSEFDDEDGHTSEEDSDDSWTTQEEFTSELILSMMTNNNKDSSADKPFACPVPGCKKRYKNINGIKYHAKHGHKKEVRVRKPYKCKCGKSYKSTAALQTHSQLQHQGSLPSLLSLKPRATPKPRPKQPSVAKTKAGGLIGKLPVAALASQAQARKHLQASLKSLASNMAANGSVPLAAPSNVQQPQPTTALVTVPVTFGKFPTTNGKINSEAGLAGVPGTAGVAGVAPQQHMLNLIAPSGLVPPGTTITVPMEQIARNLALLQHVSKGSNIAVNSPAVFSSGGSLNGGATNGKSVLASAVKDQSLLSAQLLQGLPEMAVPNCMNTEEETAPFSFADPSFDDSGHGEDMDEISLDKSQMEDSGVEIMNMETSTTTATGFSQVKDLVPNIGEIEGACLESSQSDLRNGSDASLSKIMSSDVEICI